MVSRFPFYQFDSEIVSEQAVLVLQWTEEYNSTRNMIGCRPTSKTCLFVVVVVFLAYCALL